MLFRRRGLSKQLQQGVAVVKVHVLLNAILLAERQQHVGTATCRGPQRTLCQSQGSKMDIFNILVCLTQCCSCEPLKETKKI